MNNVYSSQDIAQWFINRSAMDVDMFYGDYITNMKLQKLLYFAQGLSFAIFGKAMFKDAIQAWDHGPVVPDIFHKYKVCGAGSIEDVNPVKIDAETAALLEFVYKKYGIYSASQLRNLSHEQSPYKDNYVPDKKNIVIPNADIKQEFSKDRDNLIDEYAKNKKEFSSYAETCYINSVSSLKERLQEDESDYVEVNWKDEL